VAVYRRRYTVFRQDLTRAGYRLLGRIAAGEPLGKAVAKALSSGRGARPTEDELFAWFRGWMAAGMFGSVEVGQAGPVLKDRVTALDKGKTG
jgi:hypothetical protein